MFQVMPGIQNVKDRGYIPRKKPQNASLVRIIKNSIKAKASDKINQYIT